MQLATEAAVHIRRLEAEVGGLRETVNSTEDIRRKYQSLDREHSELQDAHVTQAKYVRKLEAKIAKVLLDIVN